MILLAVSGMLSDRGRRALAQLFIAVPLVASVTAVYGYLYGVDVYRGDGHSTMAMNSAVILIVLACALWLSVPFGFGQWVAFGRDTGAALQRMLVPVAVVLLPFVGWLEMQGAHAGWYADAFGHALLMTFMAVVVGVVGYRAGRTGLSMDQERDALLDELHRVNAGLEDRVRVRSHQLDRQRTKLSLFEERDRIARDLHDRVIQRIFAAGLQVAGLARTARKDALRRGDDAAVADSLDVVATELDLAIRELRNSIFELTSVDHDDVAQVVQDIAARASRILGFMPGVEVSGATAELDPDLVAQVASVVQEGLSNIARHAYASAADIAVAVGEGDVWLRITDDGVGLPDPLPRSSGVNNMLNRARALGGAASWTANEPTGTVLEWRVPKIAAAPKPVGLMDGRGYAKAKATPVATSDIDQSPAASTGS
jgi:signal transduction histidine kinase